MTVFVLQTWIASRTIDGCGVWLWDLNDLFMSLEEAETCIAEFFREDKTRIVRMELSEIEVVRDFHAEDVAEIPSGQKLLF